MILLSHPTVNAFNRALAEALVFGQLANGVLAEGDLCGVGRAKEPTRERVGAEARARRVEELEERGLPEEIETPGEGQVRALITVAGNPVLSNPASRKNVPTCTSAIGWYGENTEMRRAPNAGA